MLLDNSFFGALFNVLIPAFILFFFSREGLLGPAYSFLLALIFPLVFGILYMIQKNKWSFFSIVGFVSILLTGGFGLLQLEAGWLIAKETGIPLVIGIFILFSQKTKKPFMKIMLAQVLNLDMISKDYKKNNKGNLLKKHIKYANGFFALTFFIGAILNFSLASSLLQSPPGTPEYAREVGTMGALAFPVIVLPVMIFIFVIFTVLAIVIEKNTKKQITEYMS